MDRMYSARIPMNILLQFRNGNASNFPSLLEALGIADDRLDSLHYHVEDIVRRLIEANLLEVEGEASIYRRLKDRPIKISQSWQGIQTALDISLTQLATLIPHRSLIVNPIFGVPPRLTDEEYPEVFVLMPFRAELKPVYEDHIKKVTSELKLSVKRADDFFTAKSVMQDIWKAVNNARLLIADCTDKNPNVFYEIGLAHVLGKSVILITQNDDDVPFDLRHIRYIKYQLTPRGMNEFEASLRGTILGELNYS